MHLNSHLSLLLGKLGLHKSLFLCSFPVFSSCFFIFKPSIWRLFVLFLFFVVWLVGWFCHTHGIWEFLGPPSNSSRNCNLHHSYGNARSLNHYVGPGIEPLLPQRHSRSLTHCTTVRTPSQAFWMAAEWGGITIILGFWGHFQFLFP